MECRNNTVKHGEDFHKLRIKEEPLNPDETTTKSQASHVQQIETHFVMCRDLDTKVGIVQETWGPNLASYDIKSNPKQSYTCLGKIMGDDVVDIKEECVYQDEVSPGSQKLNSQQIETTFMEYNVSSDVDTKVGIKKEPKDPNGVTSNIKCDPFSGTGSTDHDEVDIKEERWCEEISADSLNQLERSGTKKNEAAEEDIPLLESSRHKACSSSAVQMEQNKNASFLSAETSETKHRCKACGKTFKNLSNLLKHNLVPKECKWRNCNKNCTYSDVFKDCVIHSHRRQYICDTCGRTFSHMGHLKLHLVVHDDKRQHKCQMCEKSFSQLAILKSHLLVHDDKRQYKCHMCEKSFKRPDDLKKHLLIHEDTKQYKCHICEKHFKHLRALKAHLLVHDDKRRHKCQMCDKSFKQLNHLKNHLLLHDEERKYKCQTCGKRFKQLRGLKYHLLVHDDKRHYKCQICEKSFKQSGVLKSHLSVHDDKRQYKCEMCEKSFKRSAELKKHLLVHEVTKQYKCQTCAKCFKHLRGLKSHLVVHDDKRPFKCEICSKTFKWLACLKSHVLIHND